MADDEPLPEELAASYRADPQHDPVDLVAGWTALRPRLTRRLATLRFLIGSGIAAGILLVAAAALLWRMNPKAPRITTTTVSAPSAEYTRAVTDLEAALHAGREHLQPDAVAAIDRSLAAIDRAIQDAEAALAADATNDYAAEWLDTMRHRKLRALRQAVSDL